MYPLPLSRGVVYWLGPEPSADERTEFARRGLTIHVVTKEQGDLDFTIARGAVFSARPPQFPEVCARLTDVQRALEHGLFVYVLAEDDTAQGHIGGLLPESVLSGSRVIRRRTGRLEAYEIPETIARHDPRSAYNSQLQITAPAETNLTEMDEFLLRRAFSDCASIALSPLSGGRSARAFVVQATLQQSDAGPRPLPFFAKLDDVQKIDAEIACYQNYATQHILWYLRPNLDLGRCVKGTMQGILVGSFVDQSESLWEAALKSRGSRYIHALFEDTLMGWRAQAFRQSVVTGRLASALASVFEYKRVPPENVTRARDWGDVADPRTLREQLLNLPAQSWRFAPMHGDMHGENVRVRNGDAIIIDLAKTSNGPLCADVASMDVWLAFETPRSDLLPKRDTWTSFVTHIYDLARVDKPPHEEIIEAGIEWLRPCIRTLRMISSSICTCDTEYATCIALYLLRRASYRGSGDTEDQREEDCYRRAYAYFLGARLVEALSQSSMCDVPAADMTTP